MITMRIEMVMTDPEIQTFVDQIQESGYCLFPDVIPASECEPLERHLSSVGEKLRREAEYEELTMTVIKGLMSVDQSVAEYLADHRVLAVLESLFGKNIRISFTSLLTNEPGKERSNMHADWPFNQNNVCHFPAPYPDRMAHATALLMISAFTEENGGTLVIPGSHRRNTNPTDKNSGYDEFAEYPDEIRVTSPGGGLLLMDSRTWHCSPANNSSESRVCVALRYAPWWLNLEALDPESELRKQWVDEPGLRENDQARIPREAYEQLPEKAKPLLRHWIRIRE